MELPHIQVAGLTVRLSQQDSRPLVVSPGGYASMRACPGAAGYTQHISDDSSNNREAYEYGGIKVEYLNNTDDCGSTQDASGVRNDRDGRRVHMYVSPEERSHGGRVKDQRVVLCVFEVTCVSRRHPSQANMSIKMMKKKLSELRKGGSGKKRRNNEPKSSQSKRNKPSEISLPPLTPSALSSRSSNLTSESPFGSLNRSFTPNSSFGLLAPLPGSGSPFRSSTQPSDVQDNLSKSKARIKELKSDAIGSEEMSKKKIKDLKDTVIQSECKYSDLDLSWVYEVETPSGSAGTGDTPADILAMQRIQRLRLLRIVIL
ncbi:hypothetical protein FNV43_RR07410 [Rhamnella rubrinervis]|uniref:Uncharacterized protein n=1 Tax=Rhamnella rubrinervis TaxID=2594499 RepID=A0A8K0HFB3_9ROSA|nr:hypothetical protein FNV43_RR07410 [Rhamnella rubrinervis]